MIVTIDGPAGAGKSTVSRILARRLGLPCLHSGYIYRAVTLLVSESGGRFEDRALVEKIIKELDLRFVDDPPRGRTRVFNGEREFTDRLKDPEVTAEVYRVANDGGYRERLVELQRRFAEPDGVVAEGRDMGTVIFPGADFKFYLDASAAERARRRHEDLRTANSTKTLEEVLASVTARDARDRNREHAPLRLAEGAVVVRTEGLTVEDVVKKVLAEVEAR